MTLQSGQVARNAGMAQVTQPKWVTSANTYFTQLTKGFTGIGEDIRHELVKIGCPEPHHPNAWGAWINGKIRGGELKRTGEFAQMKETSSHARFSQKLEVV